MGKLVVVRCSWLPGNLGIKQAADASVQVFGLLHAYGINMFQGQLRPSAKWHPCWRALSIYVNQQVRPTDTNSKPDVPLIFVSELGYLQKCVYAETL